MLKCQCALVWSAEENQIVKRMVWRRYPEVWNGKGSLPKRQDSKTERTQKRSNHLCRITRLAAPSRGRSIRSIRSVDGDKKVTTVPKSCKCNTFSTLGKDEVASSNLASSSKKKPRTPTGFRLSSFSCCMLPTPKTDTKTDTAVFYHTKLSYNSAPWCANMNRHTLWGCICDRSNYSS